MSPSLTQSVGQARALRRVRLVGAVAACALALCTGTAIAADAAPKIDVENPTFPGVSVVPKTLPVDSGGGDPKVTLEGPELVDYLTAHGSRWLVAILYGDGGETTEAKLRLPDADEANLAANRVRAPVSLTGSPPPGEYKGTLAFPGLPADANSVAIELDSHWCWWWALALVFAGIVTLGIGTRMVTTATRRKLLRATLNQTHEAYRHVAGTGMATRSWRLDDLLAEGPEGAMTKEDRKTGRLHGLEALRYSIDRARSAKDLDEDAARVLDMVARMQRWLRVEPLARRLDVLENERSSAVELPGKSRKAAKLSWEGSNTLRDTRVLLTTAKSEPADVEKADDLVARLLFQATWHNTVWALWEKAGGNQELAAAVRGLDEALDPAASKAATRTIADQDQLAAQLRVVWTKFDRWCSGPPRPPSFVGEPVSPEGRRLGLTDVKWDASWNLFTGWATLDGASYGQLSRRAATSSRAQWQYMPGPPDLWAEAKLLRLPDAFWTLAILGAASAAYVAVEYDSTWGGNADLATAFLAGALGKATIDWAALPIFQSLRVRKAE